MRKSNSPDLPITSQKLSESSKPLEAKMKVNTIKQPIASTTAKPTMRLRWVPRSMKWASDLKLQQAWEITHYDGVRPTRLETEWRDIPVETTT